MIQEPTAAEAEIAVPPGEAVSGVAVDSEVMVKTHAASFRVATAETGPIHQAKAVPPVRRAQRSTHENLIESRR